jgi:hypothetical protein
MSPVVSRGRPLTPPDCDRSWIVASRLDNQSLSAPAGRGIAALVSALGAVQAQEFEPAKWAIGQRVGNGVTDAAIERAFAAGQILRTHVLRPTWHFVPRADIRWMLALTAPNVHRRMNPYNRQLGLDAPVMTKALGVIERALDRDGHLTRAELRIELGRAGSPADPMRVAHIMMHAELEALVCSGPRRERQFTYALLATRAPDARRLDRDEAIAALSRRFFSSHGPATLRDFSWWSGLSMTDAKRSVEIVRARQTSVDGYTYWSVSRDPRGQSAPPRRRKPAAPTVHLLPIYDEYLVAYRDRVAVPHGPPIVGRRPKRFVTFQHALVVSGQVVGTWRVVRQPDGAVVTVVPLRRLTGPERHGIAKAASRYERYLGVPVTLTIDR